MVKILTGSWLIALLIACPLMGKYEMRQPNSYYLPGNWPEYSLRLTRNGALSELFEAGLRPGYMSTAKNTELGLKHVRLTLILADGRLLPEFPAELGRITVTRAGLSRITLTSQPLSVEAAKATLVEWLPFFSESRRKSEAQLDDFLKKVAADYSGFDDRDFGAAPEGFGGGWKDENGVGYGVRFQKSYNKLLPVRVCLSAGWHYVRTDEQMRAFYRESIPAPEGFEIPILEDWGPDSISEMMYAKGMALPAGYGLSGIDKNNVIEFSEKKENHAKFQLDPKAKKSSGEENQLLIHKKTNPFLRIISGLFLVGVAFILIRTFVRRRDP